MFRMIRNLSGSSPIIGLTLSATGLYFFFAIFFFAFGAAEAVESWVMLPVDGGKTSTDETGGALEVTLDSCVVTKGSSWEAAITDETAGALEVTLDLCIGTKIASWEAVIDVGERIDSLSDSLMRFVRSMHEQTKKTTNNATKGLYMYWS